MFKILVGELRYNILLTFIMCAILIGIDLMSYGQISILDDNGLYKIRFILAFNALYPYNHRFEKQNRIDLIKILPIDFGKLGIIRILWITLNIAFLIVLDIVFHKVFMKHVEWTAMLGKGETIQILMLLISYFILYYDVRNIFRVNKRLGLIIGGIAIGIPIVIFLPAGLLNLNDNIYEVLLIITSLLTLSFTAFSFNYRIRLKTVSR